MIFPYVMFCLATFFLLDGADLIWVGVPIALGFFWLILKSIPDRFWDWATIVFACVMIIVSFGSGFILPIIRAISG